MEDLGPCGRWVCPYCQNETQEYGLGGCCGEVHAFECGKHDILCEECKEESNEWSGENQTGS